MIEWTINPLVGVGPIIFGMKRNEVAAVLGAPEFADNPELPLGAPIAPDETLLEFRVYDGTAEKHLPAVEYRGNKVISVEVFSHNDTLRVGEIYIFRNTAIAAAKLLTEISKHYVYDETSYIFMDLGISMSLEDREIEDTVNVFSKGGFDEYVTKGINDGSLQLVRKR